MANSGKNRTRRRGEGGGRVTPKGGPARTDTETRKTREGSSPEESSRYTPPTPTSYYESPKWVPVLMFVLFGLGMLVIFFHYVEILLPAATSNWWLLAGLGSILGGIVTATQYR